MENRNPHIGSSFDDFLAEEGILSQVSKASAKEVLAEQIVKMMEENGIGKTEMASRMGTSRSSLDRLLDPDNNSVTLSTMERAAMVLGKSIRVEIF